MVSISNLVTTHRPDLDPLQDFYKRCLAYPELSNQEASTATAIADHLVVLFSDFNINTSVLLCTDMETLPRMQDAEGVEKPVMHTGGHDMQIVCLLGAAEILLDARDSWSGTPISILKPGGGKWEGSTGHVLGVHVMPFQAGSIGTRRGLFATSADSMKVTLHGRIAHAAMPERSIDPVIMRRAQWELQTIMVRETDPAGEAVLKVAIFYAGDAQNVIGDLGGRGSIRDPSHKGRGTDLGEDCGYFTGRECGSYGVKGDNILEHEELPVDDNDDTISARLEETFAKHFGKGNGYYGGEAICFFMYAGKEEVWDWAQRHVQCNHLALFAPGIMPTLRIGIDGYAAAALTL
ncbi:uncharacterized protein BCR38DRAFT_500841 [Pseudomassariella vexata]|uniref:Peptidase M20 dimerisation domain-containing protein n=1 Tax=Pseudomassariella vexata TaxID=1141098 RepID=A0A1Y2DG96_9PEZI|nr:uncharacterized protein BCR38DRAFT_500841 [Pseudomassariella vexata]ORY58104.1 hypothetical protein BCR38DRAFT_500841 [Pseudomassariella vexata]